MQAWSADLYRFVCKEGLDHFDFHTNGGEAGGPRNKRKEKRGETCTI